MTKSSAAVLGARPLVKGCIDASPLKPVPTLGEYPGLILGFIDIQSPLNPAYSIEGLKSRLIDGVPDDI